jgi:glycosidase
MPKTTLHRLLEVLRNTTDSRTFNYTVPDLWNCFDYQSDHIIHTPSHELMVNPYEFYAGVIEQFILPKAKPNTDYSISLASHHDMPKRGYQPGDWIKESFVYSAMVRASAAWDHDRSGALEDANLYDMPETGSFVKMLALLPLLVKMGVDVLYLLPISKFSRKDKKGELGSPYGVSNFNELDPALKDPLVGDAMTLEEEFQAFVEACHMVGIRVMIDIIPRTNSVDSDLIREHPEWFYWIQADEYEHYRAPRVPEVGKTAIPNLKNMASVYQSTDAIRHLDMFRFDPKTTDPERWTKIKRKRNLAQAIEQEYNLRVAPAFSDYINDPQPPWSDVTFFRLYLDHPAQTRDFLDDLSRPPYILFDTIKCDMYQGDRPNLELWRKLADIIPSFQRRFGIDGARIDMGHALPDPLLQMIMDNARAIDPDFAFIAEELLPAKSKQAKAAGYNTIVGNGFVMEPRVWEGKLQEFVYKSVDLALPTLALGESHDTPRLAARDGGESLARLLTIVNLFVPNGIPFLNSGQEVYERQPMNTGLDARDNEAFVLDEQDPYYGKLALFDRYQFHYTNARRWELPNILEFLQPIRKSYVKSITNPKRFLPLYAHYENQNFLGLSFYKTSRSNKQNVLLVLANADTWHEHYIKVDIRLLREVTNNTQTEGRLLFSTHEGPRAFTQFLDSNTLDIHLGPGEVKIVEL